MPKTSFKNNENIAQSIKQRHIELGLTIEEAAKKNCNWNKNMESL
ncbi:hypothetical protein [Streptococcus equinus]|nr:hypothetical protein [Streptococcus equinus]SFQ62320.1 hypothetical protein SAMN05216422_0683 [Streptococcus equinus]